MSRAVKRKRADVSADPIEVNIDDSDDDGDEVKPKSAPDPAPKRRKLSEVASELELNGVVVPKPSNSKPIPEKYLKLLGDQANETTPPEVQCAICLDAVTTPTLMSDCEHVFCWVCIDQWTKQTNNCPECRKQAKWIKTKFVMADGPNKGKQDVKYFDKKHDRRLDNYVGQLNAADIQRLLDVDDDEAEEWDTLNGLIGASRPTEPQWLIMGLTRFSFRGAMQNQSAQRITGDV